MFVSVKIGIVLTGTIKPNSNFVAITNVAERRQQYLEALEYYRHFAPVWFMENSEYDLEHDEDFNRLENVNIIKCPVSDEFFKGKGYQEFEMLDSFFSLNDIPETVIKITGRYIIEDFGKIVQDSMSMGNANVLVNLHKRRKYADTYLLAFKTAFYRDNLMELYKKVNDDQGVYIEHVYYEYFSSHIDGCRLFKHEVDISAISGSTGIVYAHSATWKKKIKCILRKGFVAGRIKILPW